jgi:hypothetical protein
MSCWTGQPYQEFTEPTQDLPNTFNIQALLWKPELDRSILTGFV